MGAELGSEQRQIVFTIEHCDFCNINNKRSFQKGDYVVKASGRCPKCGRDMYISAIYAESLRQQA
ncbi:MAG: hypothetical protein QXT39_02795 [Conexivisphaerales archaeon]